MVLVYCPKITPRVKYAFSLVFEEVLQVPAHVTGSRPEFNASDGIKINYSTEEARDCISFAPHGLLTGSTIIPQNFNKDNLDLPSDPFAFSFYLATRYEEYLPHEKDKYGRYLARNSFAYKNGMVGTPLVNVWAGRIRDLLLTRYPRAPFPQRQYQYISTIDIDNAYAYLEKGTLRTAGAYARSVLKGRGAELAERKKVLSGKEKDPYDTYDLLFSIQKKHNIRQIYFFLLADWAKNDRSVPASSKKFQDLIRAIAERSGIGIHGSFASNADPEKLGSEIARLKKISGRDITSNRQHFLMLDLPQTYRSLLAHGITDDYTMGYAEEPGFRAGLCTPYYWYDLEKEEQTRLRIHPFAVMDATLNLYKKYSAAEAVRVAGALIEKVKMVNGTFISLWHNESLGEKEPWKGWRDVYEQVVKRAV